MTRELIAPVLAGLAAGIAFIIVLSVTIISTPTNQKQFPVVATNNTTITQPKITQKQAIDIAIHDISTNYIRNPDYIRNFNITDHHSNYVDLQRFIKSNWTLTLIYLDVNGTVYGINPITHKMSKCPSIDCIQPREEVRKIIEGRLEWIVDSHFGCIQPPPITSYSAFYVIDANNGKIIWRGSNQALSQPMACR